MPTHRPIVALLALVPLFGACHTASVPPAVEVLVSDDSPLASLSWMNGSWASMSTSGVRTEEHWTPSGGGMMLGMHRTVRGGGSGFFEFARIVLSEGGMTYFASPRGGEPVPFYLAEQDTHSVTFSNPEHDFPQVIRYWLADDGVLHARVNGESRGQPVVEAYAWRPAEIAR